MAHQKILFVTVGTTLFDALIGAMTNPSVLTKLADLGFTKMILQYGKGTAPPVTSNADLTIEAYQFKPTLTADLARAHVVIGHAGAGTVSETLALGKKLIVVINTSLMHNHQTELAYAMRNRGYCYVVEDPRDLLEETTWDEINAFTPVPVPQGDAQEFPNLLTAFLNC